MKRKKRFILALNLLLGGFVVSTLSGCEGEVSAFYTLNLVYDSTLGSVTSDTPKGVVGDTVNVTITPNEGIVVDSVKVNGEEAEFENGVLTFTAVGGTNTVEVTFKDPSAQPPLDTSFSVKAEYDSSKGSVTIDKTAGEDYSDPTSVVKVTITPNSGYFVESVTLNGESRDASVSEFVFQPKQGENIINVTFKEVEGPVDEHKKYTFKVTYNEEGGSVVGDKTAGEIGEGTKVTFIVTPNENYFIKSVTFNRKSLEISANNTYEVIPIEGENTFDVLFEEKEVEPPVQTYSINVNVVNQEGGSYTLSKTEGNVGETVALHVEPTSGFTVQVLFNSEIIALDENFDAILTPVNGVNELEIIFAKPASALEALEDGFDITFSDYALVGNPDFDCAYFSENFFSRIYDVISGDDRYKKDTTNDFFEYFISKTNLTKEKLEYLNAVIDKIDFLNRLEELLPLSAEELNEENFKKYITLIIDLKTNLTNEDFSYLSLLFVYFTSYNIFNVDYPYFYGGLSVRDSNNAISYFESKGDTETANEIKTFFSKTYSEESYRDGLMREIEKTALYGSQLLYPMIDSLLNIESDKDKLSSLIFNVFEMIRSYYSQNGIEEIFKDENKAKNIETIQFIGRVLYRSMPNIDSFKKLVEKTDVAKNLINFVNDIFNKTRLFKSNVLLDGVFENIRKDSDSLYYTLKFIGKSLENINEDDYKAIVELIKYVSSGNNENVEIYKSAIKISKLFVRTLFEFGNAQELLSEKFETGFSLIGNIIATIYKMNVRWTDCSYEGENSLTNYSKEKFTIALRRGENAFGNFDFTKLSDFIATVSQYQSDNLGETEITYIQSFFNEINEGLGSFFSNENYETYTVEYISNPKLNDEFKVVVGEPSDGGSIKYNIEKADTSTRIADNFKIEFEGYGDISFGYSVGSFTEPINGRLTTKLDDSFTDSVYELLLQSDYEFKESDGLYFDYRDGSEPKLIYSFKNNLDISKTGWNYKRIEIEERVYFFEYCVYKEEDIIYEYELGYRGELYVGKEIEITYIYYSKYFNDGDRQYYIDGGSYELASPIKLDTTKAGENTVTLNLANGQSVEVSYYVYEVISSYEQLICIDNSPNFEYEDYAFDPEETFPFEYVKEVVAKTEGGTEFNFSDVLWTDICTSKEFENKLDNSEAGKHTDYLIKDGKKYEFTYEVRALLDSSDKDFQYYIDEPYLLGDINGFINNESELRVSYLRRLYYEDGENGYISRIEYNSENPYSYLNLEENDFSNIEVGEAGSLKEVEVILNDGKKVSAKLYFSNYEVESKNSYLENASDFAIDNLPSDDYKMNLTKYIDIVYNTWNQSREWGTYLVANKETTFGEIKNNLDLSTPGDKTSEIELDGEVFTISYSVIETLVMTFGDYLNFENTSTGNYAVHIENLDGYDEIVLKTLDSSVSQFYYMDNSDFIIQDYYGDEYEYKIINISDYSDLWLNVYLYQQNSYFEIVDLSQVETEVISESLFPSDYYIDENGDYNIVINFRKTLIFDDYIYHSSYYSSITAKFTFEQLQEFYVQTGDPFIISVPVEIYGNTYNVIIDADWFPELTNSENIA